MQSQDFIGLDVGEVRTGIARASSIARLAEPLKVVETGKVTETLRDIFKAGEIAGVVVGLPRNLNGDDTQQTKWVREWAAQVKDKLDAKIYFQDEALTTELANNKDSDPKDLDARAAAIILQDFLDSEDSERVEA